MKILITILALTAFLTFQSCSKSKTIVTEQDIYSFMNAAIFHSDSTITDQKEFEKIHALIVPFSESIRSFIWTLDIGFSDKFFLQRQIDQELINWDCSKLQNVVCIPADTIERIFSIGSEIVETNSGFVFIDAWEDFRKKYGNGGLHRYSTPIFNKDKDFAIVEHGGQGDWELGSGTILVFKKTNDKWEIHDQKELWISENQKRKIYSLFANCPQVAQRAF